MSKNTKYTIGFALTILAFIGDVAWRMTGDLRNPRPPTVWQTMEIDVRVNGTNAVLVLGVAESPGPVFSVRHTPPPYLKIKTP